MSNLLNNLNSGKNIKQTYNYVTVNDDVQRAIPETDRTGADSRCGIGKEEQQRTSMVEAVGQAEQIKQVTQHNRMVVGLAKSQEDMIKLQEKQANEYAINQLRSQLALMKMMPLQKELDVAVPFPLEKLPDWTARLISETAYSLQVPKEAVAPGLLGATFIGARGNYVVQVKKDYQEAVTEYILVIMPSGGRKSAIVGFFRKPIDEVEAELQIAFDLDAPNRKIELEALIAIKEKYKAKFMSKLNLKSLANLKEYAQQVAEVLEPVEREIQNVKARPKLLMDSPTSKALAMEMARQDEAIGLFEPEGGVWKHRIRASDDNIYLKSATMEPFGDETNTAGTAVMRRPCLACCSYVQGVVAEILYSKDGLKRDGLLPRILPAFVSWRDENRDPNPMDVSDELVEMYSAKIRSLLDIQRPEGQDGERPLHVLELTDDARKLWRDYASHVVAGIHAGRFTDFEAFGEKLAGHAVRLAGAVHLLKHEVPHEHMIDAETMDAGIALAEFFAEHAVAAYDKSRLQGLKYAKKILNWVDRHRKPVFTARQVHRGVGHCKSVDITAGLDLLEQHGIIGRYVTTKQTFCVVSSNYGYDSKNW